jgi:Uma2 family endonuclease
MQKTAMIIGQADQGRRMALADFDHAATEDGRLYELSRGIVTMIDVPCRKHLAVVNALKRQIHAYDGGHPDVIHTIATGSECKLSIVSMESERHPDLAIYKTPPPDGADFWSRWVPEIVVEIVSRSGRERGYVEKREEYWQFGVQEYWVVDTERREVLVLARTDGQWSERVVAAEDDYSTSILAGFALNGAALFAAADAASS